MKHTKNTYAKLAETAGIERRSNRTSSHSNKVSGWLRLTMAVLILGSMAFAQSLTVTPNTYTVVTVGGTQQYTATANGFTISSIKWEAGSVVGGNSTAGAISTSGLYTAPAAIPGQNPVAITAVATSTAGPKYTATVYVTIAPQPPVITQVTPNPLATGTINVTITGSGFQTGAQTLISYGNNSGIQMVTSGVTSGSLKANGYLGNATSASFCVKNPGTACSNALTVPVGNAPVTYPLTVVNGTGSGNYAAGTVVTIKANAAPSGQQFQSWSGASVANANASTTTLTMPAAATTVTAGYMAIPPATYSLTVVNGSGSGTYAAGTVVTITANAPPVGQQFQSWTGASVANVNSASTTLTMPAANTTVTASYSSVTYALTVVGGSGSGNYAAGAVVTITANAAPAGQQFQSWSGASVANANSASTTLTMPAAATTVTASFAPITYALTVVGGSGSGSYAAGTLVTITATVPSGQQFQSWSGASVANANSASTTLTMPAAATTVTAQFVSMPSLTITNVSPNPLPTGTVTVTITGTGFTSSSNIWDSGVQYGAQLSGNTLTTSVYTAPGTATAAFSVHDSSSVSNTITVPVSGPPTFNLTVVNGTGSGAYTAGTSVTIVANAAPAGQSFTGWTGPGVSNANATTTTVTMPAADTTVTANYAAGPVYALTVINGQGSGSYPAGAVVTITANNPPAGQSFISWTGASVANATASSTTLTMPAAAATVTATFTQPAYMLTVVNGAGSGSYQSGTVVTITANAPPAGLYFQSWSGAAGSLANANQPTTTITMPQADTTVTATFGAGAAMPFPVTAHPRLWLTPADLPRYQSWANNSNPMYTALGQVLSSAIANYNLCFPGAQLTDKNPTPANPYPDFGDTQGYTGVITEESAVILAFQSLIDPSPANRSAYAQAARNMIMYALNQANLGQMSGAPFRDRLFLTYNRGSAGGHEWALVVDWIYNATDSSNQPILTAADKAVIQSVFMQWSNTMLTASTTGGDNPGAPGVINSLSLLPGNKPYRMASNNYYLAHARNLTMMALALDPADDPAVNPTQAPSTIGNTLRSYILDANGAWLYEIYAMMGDPATVAAAYGVPGNPTGAGFGLASGGLPPEGFLYGESFAYVLGQLLALQTAGFNDPSISGPQIGLIGAPVWDRYVVGYLSSLLPQAQTFSAEPWLGPVFQFAGYGDMLREYVTPDDMRPFTLLTLLEQENGGNTQHLNTARWFTTNVPEGGAASLMSRVSDPWTWGVSDSFLAFMLYDPSAPAAADPRPTFPTQFYDAPQGRIVAHSDWTPAGSMFSYKATWTSINHQDNTGGQFELFRNGEWLTKEMSNYDNNAQGSTTVYHNTLALQNWSAAGTPSLNWDEGSEWTNGSQWMWGASAGDPTTITSNGPGYTYASSDLTNMYNKPDVWSPNLGATDVTQATRSILWLNNVLNNVASSDYIVVYDRATTQHTGLFKRFNLSLVTAPVTTTGAGGSTIATETMNSGQQLFIQTLLPQNAATSYFNGAVNMNPIAELEPTQFIYQVQDPANPADTRFLHVLQGANSGAGMVAATYVQSTTGTAFDGASFGSNAVFFPVSTSATFAGTTLPVTAATHTVMIAGMTPGAGYTVSVANNVVTVVPGGATTADSAGLLKVSF
jgi:hypothetical protein